VDYDPADNAAKSYEAAIEALRERLLSIPRQIIGDCTLYNGDCRDVLPLLPKVDAVVTDPPYGIGWTRGQNKARNSKPHDGILNDGDTSARDAVLSLMQGTPAAVFGSFYAPFPEETKQVLVWHKPADSGLVGSVTGFRRDAEPIFLTGKWPTRTVESSSVLRTLAGQAGTVSETGHPHTKPVSLMRAVIELVPGTTILDPFMGSGSTGVACVRLGRKFIGIEIDPDYFNVACLRIVAAYAQPDLFVEAPTAAPVQLNMLGAK
jgi:DNA modification methylase